MSFESFPQKRAHVLYSTVTLQYALLAALLYIYAILLPAAGCVALDDLWWKAGKANRALHISLFVSVAALAGGPVRLNHRPVKALGAEWTLYEGGGGGAPHPPPFLSPPAVAGTRSRTLTLRTQKSKFHQILTNP
jgi:hypothetical protein